MFTTFQAFFLTNLIFILFCVLVGNHKLCGLQNSDAGVSGQLDRVQGHRVT